jgi:signal transduction histidine kinase
MQIPIKDIINFLISGTLFLVILAGFIVLLVKLFDKARKNFALEKENISKEYETQLLQTQLEIQEQTLENISQEIHDNIGQALSFVKLNINTIDLNKTEETANKLGESKDLITKAIQDLRNLSKTLNPSFIHDTGLVSSIQYQLAYLQKTGVYHIDFQVSETIDAYPQRAEIVLFRIVQELLNNIVKHAEATAIQVTLQYREADLLLTVKDNGKGFKPNTTAASAGLGLKNMKKRLAMIAGYISLESEPDKGTQVFITIPNTPS